MADKLVHKNGYVDKTSDWIARRQKEQAEKTRMRNSIRGDYYKHIRHDMSRDEAVAKIMADREVTLRVVNYALNTGTTTADATMTMSARAIVLQDMEEQALSDFIEWQDMIIDEIMDSEQEFWTIEKTEAPAGDTEKQLPKNEYLKKLLKEKLLEFRESKKTLGVFKRDINQVNILITESERDERMREAAKKFSINTDFEVKDGNNA